MLWGEDMGKKAYDKLIEKVKEINYLNQVNSLLRWDQETYIPKGSVPDRAEQISIMSGIVHDRQTSKELGKLLDELRKDKDLDDDQAIIVREVTRDHHRATALPPDLVKELSKTESLSMEAWAKARKEKDFKQFKPWLEKMIGLKMQVAEHIGYEDQPYDALLDEYEPTMKVKDVEAILTRFRKKLVPLVAKIIAASKEAGCDDSLCKQHFDTDKQRELFTAIIKDLGYSFDTGRLDVTTHPFTIGLARDIRITTRYKDDDIRPALFACIHEAGHGIYEQGHLEKWYHTPLGQSESLGIHESQSRLYENIVGRSRNFWKHYLPKLKKTFPQIKEVKLDDWHRSINTVQPSFIRVEADEVTYNLHILVRFELEKDIIDGKVKVDEIPDLWNEKMEKYVGVVPTDDALGCLQDIHWSFGLFGYFATYTLGNLLAAQLWDKIRKDIPTVEEQISKGKFGDLLGWLRENVHQNGRRYRYLELTEKATGASLNEDLFLDYLKDKFGPLFGVSF
jgi:carboxypeptidase Taq